MNAYVYTLTSLTGRKRNEGRSVIINGFEFGRRALTVVSVAVGASLIPALILGTIFGPLAFIITPAVTIAGAFLLVERRTRNGLQVRMYQSMLDKKKANVNEFYICFRPVGESLGMATLVTSSSVQRDTKRDVKLSSPPVFTSLHRGKDRKSNSVSSLIGSTNA
jgi:hypothetical protein